MFLVVLELLHHEAIFIFFRKEWKDRLYIYTHAHTNILKISCEVTDLDPTTSAISLEAAAVISQCCHTSVSRLFWIVSFANTATADHIFSGCQILFAALGTWPCLIRNYWLFRTLDCSSLLSRLCQHECSWAHKLNAARSILPEKGLRRFVRLLSERSGVSNVQSASL